MQMVIEKVARKAARALSPVLYPLLRAHAVKLPDAKCDASGLETLEHEFRPLFAGAPSPDRSAWSDEPEVDVSFVMPCYNAEHYVAECVGSILAQEAFRSFEVIAIDDGSTDATGTILDDLAIEDERLRVFHQRNRGFSGARNAGLEKARGRLSSWILTICSHPRRSNFSSLRSTIRQLDLRRGGMWLWARGVV